MCHEITFRGILVYGKWALVFVVISLCNKVNNFAINNNNNNNNNTHISLLL